MILARLLPDTAIVGVELEKKTLDIARLRAAHYGYQNITFYQSPSGDVLPSNLGSFDVIFLPAVFEHLLPKERERLMSQLWNILLPNGVLFIDETPHRWFPIETHTSRLPFINYLPDNLAFTFAKYFSPYNMQNDTWPSMLRKGIRGATSHEILSLIKKTGGSPLLLSPISAKRKDCVDIWFEGYAKNASGTSGKIKRFMRIILKIFNAFTGAHLVPYLSLAIKKQA